MCCEWYIMLYKSTWIALFIIKWIKHIVSWGKWAISEDSLRLWSNFMVHTNAKLLRLQHLLLSCEWLQGLYSLSGRTSYRKISRSLEAARFGFKLFQSLWNLAGTSAALLPMCLSNFRAIRPLQHPISRLRDFTRFGGKTSYRLVNRGPVVYRPRNG